MAKIVYNTCYGGFSLSNAALARYTELSGVTLYDEGRDLSRTDPILVRVVEELGRKANGLCARLAIHELPAGTLYRIDEYDGAESIHTPSYYAWEVA